VGTGSYFPGGKAAGALSQPLVLIWYGGELLVELYLCPHYMSSLPGQGELPVFD